MSYLEVRVALEVPDSQRPESPAPPFLLVNLETRDIKVTRHPRHSLGNGDYSKAGRRPLTVLDLVTGRGQHLSLLLAS